TQREKRLDKALTMGQRSQRRARYASRLASCSSAGRMTSVGLPRRKLWPQRRCRNPVTDRSPHHPMRESMTLATSSDDTQQPNATEPAPAPSPDAALLARVRSGDAAAFEILMRRYNQRLYRVARSVVKDSAEAEDVVQQAYLLAYVNADQFAGRSSLSTWLTRIALNEALGRVRRRGGDVTDVNAVHDWRSGSNMAPDPEDQVSRRELARLLESAVDRLPENYRVVFALRELEGLDGNEV